MSGASDKARFYLEQSIPELQELRRKKIFTKDEIVAIAKKRSDFEHKLNARGSKPIDYIRYLEYETNLDSLRQKRGKRMGSKGTGNYAAQRRMLFIMDRATRKFSGDLTLWAQYFEMARKQKAYRKASQILTSMVRLHPTKPEVWTYAAKYTSEEQGDMAEARSFMIRGLRFCKHSQQLYLDYAKLEIIYIAKIAARQRILGLDQSRDHNEEEAVADDPDADILTLPAITAEDIDPTLRTDNEVDKEALSKLSTTPALTGAIPKAIFDAAMTQFGDAKLGRKFFNMVDEVRQIPCASSIAKHIVERLSVVSTTSPYTLDIAIRLPLVGIEPTSAEFPRALRSSLQQLTAATNKNPSTELAMMTVEWIVSYLVIQELDQAIRTVLASTLSKTTAQFRALAVTSGTASTDAKSLLEKVRSAKVPSVENPFAVWVSETWPQTEAMESTTERLPRAAIEAH